MNSRTFKIAITNPCSNNWDEMDPVSVGRFCNSCQKNVIDFTAKSDSQIKEYLQKHKNEETCGRFYKAQIDTIRIEFDQHILNSDIKFWQKFLVVLLICFGNDVLGIDFCLAQSNIQDSSLVQIETDSLKIETSDSLNEVIAEDTALKNTAGNFLSLPVDQELYRPYTLGGMEITFQGTIAYNPLNGFLTEGINLYSLPVGTILLEPEAAAEPNETPEEEKSSFTDYGTIFNPGLKNSPNRPAPNSHDNKNRNLYILNESETKRKRRKKRKA